MAVQNLGKLHTFEAGQDLSGSQFCFVTMAADAQIDPTVDGGCADGVLQNVPAATGRAANVMIGIGVTKIKTGGVFAVADLLASDSTGRAVLAACGDCILGKALEAATAVNQYVTMLYRRQGVTA